MRSASLRAFCILAVLVSALAFIAPRIAASESRVPATYVVQPGDTLSDIADRFGISVDALVALNGLSDPERIVAGQMLRLRADDLSASSGATRTYRVQPGDTLWEIAQAFGVPREDIARLNDLGDGHLLPAGLTLQIPAAIVSSGSGSSGASRTYVVASGDTLSSIAEAYGVTVASIRDASGLSSDLIRVGQVLSIPSYSLPQLSKQAASALQQAAAESEVDPYLLMALSLMESGWQNHVVSSTGAIGLMQVMPDTAEWTVDHLAEGADDWHVSLEDNARVGAAYFAHLLFIEGGDVEGALASYYQGWASYKQYGMYDETRDYVDDVLALEARLRAGGLR